MEITVWGDSITYGEGDNEGLGWVGRLRKHLELKDKDNEVYNRGICGDTSEDILLRFAVEAASLQPKKIIFAVGANDSKRYAGQNINKITPDNFEKNIRNLIKEARMYTQDISFVGIASVHEETLGKDSIFSNERIQEYNQILKKASDEENIPFINTSDLLAPEEYSDGLHPNSAGYQKMFERISKTIS